MADIVQQIASLKHGTFVRVKYRTDIKPAAKFKNYEIHKIVEADRKSTRLNSSHS